MNLFDETSEVLLKCPFFRNCIGKAKMLNGRKKAEQWTPSEKNSLIKDGVLVYLSKMTAYLNQIKSVTNKLI